MTQEKRSAGIGLPDDVDLPLFSYGLLKPGELAHERVVGSNLAQSKRASIEGAALRHRDGLPLLDVTNGGGGVQGVVLWFDDPAAAYAEVGEFEPRKHYKWSIRSVALEDGSAVEANVLIGVSPSSGSAGETFSSWTSADDPVLAFGPQVITALGMEVAVEAFPTRPPDSAEMWERFFRLASAYLLLWSLVERYTALAFGPAVDPWPRVTLLDTATTFRESVRAGVQPGLRVVDSRDPSTTYRIRDDGSGAAQLWYAVRSNLSHRGKSAFQDGQLLRRCLIDLHDTFKRMLIQEIPQLEAQWQAQASESGRRFVLLLRPEADDH